MAKKVAKQLVEMLIAVGTKRMYAVAGDSLSELSGAAPKPSGYTRGPKKLVHPPNGPAAPAFFLHLS